MNKNEIATELAELEQEEAREGVTMDKNAGLAA